MFHLNCWMFFFVYYSCPWNCWVFGPGRWVGFRDTQGGQKTWPQGFWFPTDWWSLKLIGDPCFCLLFFVGTDWWEWTTINMYIYIYIYDIYIYICVQLFLFTKLIQTYTNNCWLMCGACLTVLVFYPLMSPVGATEICSFPGCGWNHCTTQAHEPPYIVTTSYPGVVLQRGNVNRPKVNWICHEFSKWLNLFLRG